MNILVINGPNLNKLGERDNEQYGTLSLEEINSLMQNEFPSVRFSFFQSNVEGELINSVQSADGRYDAIIINPGGYAHTSVALRDALQDSRLLKIEVHLSNLASREDFRQKSITASVCSGYISGFRELSYLSAVYLIKKLLEKK